MYNPCICSVMLHVGETQTLLMVDFNHWQQNDRAMIHWTRGMSNEDKVKSDSLLEKLGLDKLESLLWSHRLHCPCWAQWGAYQTGLWSDSWGQQKKTSAQDDFGGCYSEGREKIGPITIADAWERDMSRGKQILYLAELTLVCARLILVLPPPPQKKTCLWWWRCNLEYLGNKSTTDITCINIIWHGQ